MAAPSDPFSPKLQQHNSSNPGPNPSINPWGTWEELLLGSAVLKHGADNWALVSAELQSRARRSFSFTPEACRAGYQAIKRRFGADGGREGNSAAHWYEELRRLRVADLKRELKQYDSSIGSLQNKIKRLQSEEESARGKRVVHDLGAQESTQACELSSIPEQGMKESTFEPTLKEVVPDACSHMANALGDDSTEPKDDVVVDRSGTTEPARGGLAQLHASHADGIVSVNDIPIPAMVHPCGKEASATLMNGVEVRVCSDTRASMSQQGNDVMSAFSDDGKPKQEQPLHSGNVLSESGATLKSMIMDGEVIRHHTESCRDRVQIEQEVGGRAAEILTRSHDAVNSNYMATLKSMECNTCTISNEMLKNDSRIRASKVQHLAVTAQANVFLELGDTLQGNVSAKPGVSPSLKSGNIEECKNLARGATLYVDDGGGKSEESESLCSPRLKSSPANKRRWSSSGFGRETRLPDDVDDKGMVRKAVGEKNLLSSFPVESADSTEGKGQEALAVRTSGLQLSTLKVKEEISACKEENNIKPGLGAVRVEGGELSRRLSAGLLNVDTRNQSPSSTENSLLHEVWGESIEAVDKEMKRANKRRRLVGRNRKRNATTFNSTGSLEDEHATAEPPRQVDFSMVKTESMTNSHEASESMHSPMGKMENDTEAWHQAERLSGDSRFEKSEVGSYVDGNEDVSPMSRRHRREPKVSGKLIPLLESLRTICAHRCAPFFRHNQEENQMYYHMVRMPIDLGMIRAKLEEGQYSGSVHFFRDLLLMVSNALVYYPRDSSEFVAASGLRECVMKEMRHVFETERLVKQEGPSFRKRDARQLATANQGRRKGGLKLLSAMDKPARDLVIKQSDVSTSVESRRHSHQNVEGRSDDGADVKMYVDTPEGKRSYDNPEASYGLRLGPSPLVKANAMKEPRLKLSSTVAKAKEYKEPGSDKSSINSLSKDAKFKQRMSESGVEKKGEYAKVVSTSKTLALVAPCKGIEGSGRKTKAVPDVVHGPVKRGVGRPPKHSQQHGLQKAREVEISNLTRKRARR